MVVRNEITTAKTGEYHSLSLALLFSEIGQIGENKKNLEDRIS